jgi:hypothetical protein
MYGFICKRCGRLFWSASPKAPEDRCQMCGGELEPTGTEGKHPADDTGATPGDHTDATDNARASETQQLGRNPLEGS